MTIPARVVSSHPDAEALVELACGELDSSVTAGVQHHCLVCDDCARQVQALLGLRQVRGLKIPPEARRVVTALARPATAH